MGCSQNYITLSKIIAGGEFDDENEQEQGDIFDFYLLYGFMCSSTFIYYHDSQRDCVRKRYE